MAQAIRQNRPCRLSAELGLHITELVDALQNPDKSAVRRRIESTFPPSSHFPGEPKNKMLVSILIPCFNAERWVARAIESALEQTWPDKEVIVVDDGSKTGASVSLRVSATGSAGRLVATAAEMWPATACLN